MDTVVIDKAIFTAFGTLVVILLGLISYFLKASHGDLKEMLKDHEKRIQSVEKHKERTETREWLILVGCLLAVAVTVALAWARDEQTGDCYYSSGREVEVGKWRSVGDQMACIKK